MKRCFEIFRIASILTAMDLLVKQILLRRRKALERLEVLVDGLVDERDQASCLAVAHGVAQESTTHLVRTFSEACARRSGVDGNI